jgi:hypothetical protein
VPPSVKKLGHGLDIPKLVLDVLALHKRALGDMDALIKPGARLFASTFENSFPKT